MKHSDTNRLNLTILLGLPLLLIAGGMTALSTSLIASPSKPWIAPSRYARKTNPIKVDAASIAAGARVYEAQCLACHGKTGAGDGVRSGELDPPPGDLSSPEIWLQSDGELYYKTVKGRTPMPAFDKLLSTDEIWQVIAYTRTLAPVPAVLGPRFDVGTAPRTAIDAVVAAATRFHDAAACTDSAAMAKAAGEISQAAGALKSIDLKNEDKAIANLWSSVTRKLASRANTLQSSVASGSLPDALSGFSSALATTLRAFGGVETGRVYQFVMPAGDGAKDSLTWFQTEATPRSPFQNAQSGESPVVYVFGPSTSTK